MHASHPQPGAWNEPPYLLVAGVFVGLRTLVRPIAIERLETEGFRSSVARTGNDVGVVNIEGDDAVDHVMGNELQEVGVSRRNAAVVAGVLLVVGNSCGQLRHLLVQGGSVNHLAIGADVTVWSAGAKPVAGRGHLPRLEQIARPFRKRALAPPQLQRPRKRMTMHGRAPRAHQRSGNSPIIQT